MPKVGIVCDSTCDLGPEALSAMGVTMVPLTVRFGDDAYLDWVDMSPDAFYERLQSSPVLPKTSQPSPADFKEAYSRLAAEGVEEIVSIHLTSELSGTFESATMASAASTVPVRIVDTRTVSQASALAVKAAVEARDAGGDAAAVEAAARHAAESGRFYFILDTLEYLVKGGRAGKAAGLAASLLNIKPILELDASSGGVVEPFAKVKGTKKAIATLTERIHTAAEGNRIRVRLLYSTDLAPAEELRDALLARGCDCEVDGIGHVGAVIGTYAGPRAIGLGYYVL